MYSKSYNIENIKGLDLDEMLEEGMFRNGISIFTTNFLALEGELYNVFWLRIELGEFELSDYQKKLIKVNKKFTYKVQDFVLTDDMEDLFQRYKVDKPYISSPDLNWLLYNGHDIEVFDSKVLCVYDGDVLIGYGVFDVGLKTSAGITTVFDPAYNKYSLGKYIILLKILHSKEAGYDFFYPGYFAPGYKRFDYKLEFSKTASEYFDFRTKTWKNVLDFNYDDQPLIEILSKLELGKEALLNAGFDVELKRYQFFDCNLYTNFHRIEPLTCPYVLFFNNEKELENILVQYDVIDDIYDLFTYSELKHIYSLPSIEDVHNRSILSLNDWITFASGIRFEVVKCLYGLVIT